MSKKVEKLLEQLLVEIRGISSSSRTSGLQPEDEGATPSSSTKRSKKMGRPKGSKNKPKVSLNSKTDGLQPSKKVAVPLPSTKIIDDPIVSIYVNPLISINGIDYIGGCYVKQSIANVIQYMMQQYQKSVQHVTRDKEHTTKNLGEIRHV